MSAARVPTREALSINLQRQISLFLENYSILIPKDNDEVYLWPHRGVEHKLKKDRFTRLVESIVTKLIAEGALDITDFRGGLGMPLEDVVTMMEGLVRQELAAEFGVA